MTFLEVTGACFLILIGLGFFIGIYAWLADVWRTAKNYLPAKELAAQVESWAKIANECMDERDTWRTKANDLEAELALLRAGQPYR